MPRYHACKYNRNPIYYCEFQMINCKAKACLCSYGESGDETNKYSIKINLLDTYCVAQPVVGGLKWRH